MPVRLLLPWGAALAVLLAAASAFLFGSTARRAAPGTIEGRVTVHADGVRPDELRVAAVPRHAMLGDFDVWAARVDDPEPHGWFVAQCAPDGSFVLGPGLREDWTYRLSVGGRGTAGPRDQFSARRRAGERVELDAYPILGVAVRIEDQDGRPMHRAGNTWSAFIGDPAEAGVERPLFTALALNGLRDYVGDEDVLRRYVTRTNADVAPVTVKAGVSNPGRATVYETVELRWVGRGLHEAVVRLPYAIDQEPPFRVAFPEPLARALVGDSDRSSLRMRLSLDAEWPTSDVDGQAMGQAEFEIYLERGRREWTTRRLPVGRYTAKLDLMGLDLPLLETSRVPSADGGRAIRPHAKSTEFELTDAGVTLHVPDLAFAQVDIVGLEDTHGFANDWLLVEEHVGRHPRRRAQHLLQGLPARVLVPLEDVDERVTRNFLIDGAIPLRLVGDEGSSVIELGAGDRRTLRGVADE
ncbi:MAG: hypothetical protein AAGB93_04540 [Planctomycetota bacterium]